MSVNALGDPARGAHVPGRGDQGLAGLFEVVRDEAGLFVRPRRDRPGDRLGDRSVARAACGTELRMQGHFVGQGMLEGIFGDRVEAPFVHEFRREQVRERAIEVRVALAEGTL